MTPAHEVIQLALEVLLAGLNLATLIIAKRAHSEVRTMRNTLRPPPLPLTSLQPGSGER